MTELSTCSKLRIVETIVVEGVMLCGSHNAGLEIKYISN